MDVIKVLAATLKTASFNKFDLAWRSFGWAHGGGRAGGEEEEGEDLGTLRFRQM